jgi:hypothetical protein
MYTNGRQLIGLQQAGHVLSKTFRQDEVAASKPEHMSDLTATDCSCLRIIVFVRNYFLVFKLSVNLIWINCENLSALPCSA